MGLLNRIFNRSRPQHVETRAAGADYLPASFSSLGLNSYDDTGVKITETTALLSSTVWACVSIIAQTISTLPVHVISHDGTKQYDHPLHRVLSVQPNAYMTPASFREALLTNALLHGAGYAVIERDELEQVAALYPVRSSDVRPLRRNGELVFEVRVGGNTFTLGQGEIVYLLGWSLDGITPISPIRAGAQSVALDVAMQRYASKAFSGGNIGGILQTPALSKDAMAAFVNSWRENTGIDNAFKIAVLPDPMRFTPTTLDPERGQLIQSRQAQVLEICRIWKVPPSMLGILDKASYSSLEQQNVSFYQQTILPWLVKLEQAMSLVGFLESERAELELRFNADALLRPSTTERYNAYATAINNGVMTRAEARAKEGLPFIAGSDVLLVPLNMAPVGQQPPAPTPPALPQPDPSATRAMLEASVKRFVTKEQKAAQRAAGKRAGDELRSWAEAFYADHTQLVIDTLTPVLRAAGLTINPAHVAKRHCDSGIRMIESAINQKLTADEIADDLAARSSDLVDELLNNEGNDNAAAA